MAAKRLDEQAIFEVARKMDSREAREGYLQEICGHDTAIGQRVRALLKAYEESANFLEAPAAPLVGALEEPIPERPGTVIGPYKLMERIGEGGMGLVFVAEQQHLLRRKVAVKVIKPGLDTCEVIARFEAERQALALMDHPNIARVLDAGTTETGRPYFVMELVRGVEILQFCDENRLTPRERLALFVHVCQAVQHAHQKGIIHRDLKATNILVTLHDGTPVVKVIDFGVAKAIGHQLTNKTIYTRFAQMIGTPMYMSPEQAEMSGLDIDTRSDIYAMGVLLYEILTGATPFDKERLKTATYDEIRRIVREEEPPRPSRRISTLLAASLTTVSALRKTDPKRLSQLFRGELDWIVMKALEKDRNRRYETASAFGADVERYLNDEPVQACPPSALYRFGKFARRNKLALATGTVMAVAVLVTLVALGRSYLLVNRESAQKELALQEKDIAVVAARASASEATDQLFLALLNQARAGRFSRQMGQRLASLAALEKAAHIRPDARLRDEAMAALALPDVRRGPSLHLVPTGTRAVAFDGCYRSYARINNQGVISVRSIPGDTEIQSIPTKSTASRMQMSPNGQFLAVLGDRQVVQLWRVTDGKALLSEEPRRCLNVAFSPDSRQVAVATEDWILVIDLASGQQTNRWRMPARAHTLAFHPNNRRLAITYSQSTVVSIYDSAQGTHVADLPVGLMNDPAVAWHPDGLRLAVAGSDPRIQIWDVAARRKLAILEGHAQTVWALSFHPDGSLLASVSQDGVLRLWDPATGRQLMQLPLSATPQFSSTGQLGYVWQGGEQAQLLEVTPSREYRTFVSSLGAGRGPYHDGDLSPDGRLLALGMGDAGDRLWDLSSGRELAVLPSQSDGVLFQSDGLFTCDSTGLQRWPIQNGTEADNALRLGPPQTIALPFVAHRAARSRQGRSLAIVSEIAGAGLRLDLPTASAQGPIFAHPKACFVALSPDERWIASCGWHSDCVRLWNAKNRNHGPRMGLGID